MAEIKTIGEAAYSVLCRCNPLLALEQDFDKFAIWLLSVPFEERRGVYQDIGMEVLARKLEKRRSENG